VTRVTREDANNDRLTLVFLGVVAVVCILGVVMLAVFHVDAQPLVAIAGAAVGALATKITQSSNDSRQSSEDDDFAILGRAATKNIIAEVMRQMGAKE
jgi:hypothetical protein